MLLQKLVKAIIQGHRLFNTSLLRGQGAKCILESPTHGAERQIIFSLPAIRLQGCTLFDARVWGSTEYVWLHVR